LENIVYFTANTHPILYYLNWQVLAVRLKEVGHLKEEACPGQVVPGPWTGPSRDRATCTVNTTVCGYMILYLMYSEYPNLNLMYPFIPTIEVSRIIQIFQTKTQTGCHYLLDWTTGLEYWTGLLDSPLTPQY
jgi:hypothetical protein